MRILARCADCGNIQLGIKDITVRVHIEHDARTATFCCPSCGRGQVRTLCHRTSERLIDSGALLKFWRYPLEIHEPHRGAPITNLDVELFRLGLALFDTLSERAMR